MKKRLVSMILSAVLFATSVPVAAFAEDASTQNPVVHSEEGTSQGSNARKESGIDYKKNGGTFAEGYTAPSNYDEPVTELPGAEQITKAGYEFAGWYDNEEFNGEPVTSLSTADHSGSVVLYAKWTERYYYVDIPQTVNADGDKLTIKADAGGLYDKDHVSVTVQSENDWKLKSGLHSLAYELRNPQSGSALENGSVVASLTKDESHKQQEYDCNILDKPNYTGDYTDHLTFDIAFQDTAYNITYETNGGTITKKNPQKADQMITVTQEQYQAGTVLKDLPAPVKKSSTFLGWCYDEACTRYVDSKDRLLSDVTLYASYADNQPMEEVSMATYARANDVAADFTIPVTDTSVAMTPDQVRKNFTIKNVTDSSETVTVDVTEGADHTFTISNPNGWTPGAAYKLELQEKALYFTGFDPTIRVYDFTVYREEVKNVELNKEIKYIHKKELSNLTVNGKKVEEVSIAAMTIGTDGSLTEEGSDTTGTFTYKKQLEVGDQVAIYSGDVIPTMDMSSGDNSDVSFIEITGADGDKYTYRGSRPEDVLFMPDVLPLSMDKDQDGDPDNNSVTINVSDLTFGDDAMSQAMDLDSETTVDEGDYLAIYTGTMGENESGTVSLYGEITSVLLSEGKYIVSYIPVSEEDMRQTMDVYQKENVEGEDLLEDTDVQALEEDIETQAVDSGFASEVAERVADAAMETESFEELQESLKEDMNADIMVQSQGYGQLRKARAAGGAGGSRVELGVPTVKANLGTTLKHFDGDVSGLRLALEIGVPITVHVNRGADIEIMITATFEQEVRVSIDVDGSAVWKTWGFIPYIADYRVTASLELYEYTGIGLNVNFKTAETGNPVSDSSSKLRKGVNKITEELKNMMENGEDYLNSASGLVSGGDEISVSKSLAERYSELLADEADWVEIYKRPLVDQHFRVLLIIDIQVKLEFVVSANVNISIGMTYWYKNAKEYVFCVRVKERTATNDTIDLVEEQYEFTAYAMGTLGIKAGVRLTVRVGLLSTSIASVGISADVGGYAQVWGYLYYELKYTASAGRSSRAMGAMYLEIGIYLEVKFEAQALSNAFTYNPTLYENEWPLYKVGVLENVLDFAYTQDKVAEINMKREIQSVQIPDEYFKMQYMDMKTGLDDGKYYEKIYEDDTKYFNISMTNSAFTYDPATNIIRVNPGDEPEQDGEIIITWKNQEGTFNTKPCARKIKLHWDRLRDGYYIAFQSNGGSFVDAITGKYNAEIKRPEDPVRLGYTFAGWYEDMDLTIPYTIPETMPEEDRLVYAKWEAADVGYTVVDYIEGTNGTYEAQTPVKMNGRTEEEVSPVPKEREGFVTPPQLTETVKADGSLVINYYYARNKYTQTFKSEKETENGTETEVIADGNYRYGTMMPTPAVYRPGYEFLGWEDEEGAGVPKKVPSENKTYIAKWKALEGITYTVKYYVQNTDNSGYSLSETAALTGQMGEEVTAKAADLDEKVYHLKGELPKGTIKADGSLVLKVYYDLNEYKLTFDAKGGESDQTEVTARYGDKIASPMPTRKGYVFEGWYTDEACENAFGQTMPAKDMTVYAKWEKQKVNYTVRHLMEKLPDAEKENPGGDKEEYPDLDKPVEEENSYILYEEEVFAAYPEDKVTPDVKRYEGFTSPAAQTTTVDGNGNTVIEYKYARNVHKLKLVDRGVDENNMEGFGMPFGAAITEVAIRSGYCFEGWYTDKDFKNRFDGTMPDKDLTLYAKQTPVMSSYTVYHYKESVDGSYFGLTDEEVLSGLTESEVTPQPKQYEGFTSPEAKTGQVNGWGGPDIWYHYKRNSYNLTYVLNNGEDNKTSKVRYEADITNTPSRTGYAFAGWYTDEALTQPYVQTTMPAHDLTLYAKWEAGMKTYQVRHYQQSIGNSEQYDLAETETVTAKTGEHLTLAVKAYEGFTAPKPVSYDAVDDGEVTYVDYKYTRDRHQVTIHYNNGNDSETKELAYGEKWEEKPYRAGYVFAGWYTDAEFKKAFDGVVPARDITLYAKWDVQSVNYTIKHCLQNANDDGYSLGAQENFNADTDTVVTPEVKNFDGFTAPKKQQVTVEGDGTTTVIYRYTRNVHTLTLKNYDGKTDKTVEARYEMSIPKPTRAGYAFAGWYTDAKCTKEYKANMPDQDLTLYAKWEANIVNYVVEYYQQNVQGDGYTLKESSHARAAVDSEVTPEVMKYKGFEEPKTEKVAISGDGQTTVKYYYKRNVHTVTFDADSGTFAAEKGGDDSKIVVTGRYGANITVPKAPARTGYQFLGWDEDVEMTIPDKDLTYKAQWLKMEYTLQFKTGGGTTIEPIKGNYGDKINTPENPTRKGYIFKNWSKNGKKVDNLPTTMPAESHIYTAIWERETYQITYDLNGGSMKSGEKNPTTYNVDTTVFKLKNPVRAGYTFTGWSGTEITGVSDNVSVKQGSIEKREYKANWRENTYQITFILSGTEAKGSMAAKTVNYTENVTLPKCRFTCKGHSFKRWYTVDKKGKKTYYSDRQKVSKLTDVNGGVVTLYPEWEANVYNVTFDYGDGRAKTVRKTKYGDKYQFPSDPTRYGWEFKGWKKEGANTAFDMSTKELQLQDAKNITLYASWKANQKYSYRPSNSGNTYRVTDKHEYTRFTYYVDGNQTSVKTTGDSGLNPARYHLNMKNISYNAVHQNYSKMRIRISYKIKMVKDGYSDLRISYHTKSDNKDHTEWKKNTEDLKKKNGKTITCEYTLTTGSKIDVDSLTLEFDAHGVGPDRYDLSNLNVDITFE